MSVQILDSDEPKCKFISQNASISYHQWMQVIYNITDQVNASGFDFDSGQVFLHYTVGAAPSGYTDGTTVRYNMSLNSGITLGITQVNFANFTIPSTAYAYNQQVWHWLVVEDRAGNLNHTFSDLQSFIVGDSLTPTQVSATGNAANCSFHQDKTVTFTVMDPAGGSGINPSTVKCYWANGSAFSPTVEATLQGQADNDYTYMIPKEWAHYGRLDQTVYFRINASDNAGNAILSGNVYTYQVTDRQAPQNVTLWQNFTSNPNYAGDSVLWRMTLNDPDVVPSTCSRLSSAFLYVRNDSGAPTLALRNNSAQYNVVIPANISVAGLLSATVQFVINETVLSARQPMYYLFQVNDSRSGVFNYTGSFHVKDSIDPIVTFDRIRNTTDGTIINYNEDAVFWYIATEPVDAAGFAVQIRPMTVVFYKVSSNFGDAPNNMNDYSGTAVIHNSTFSSYTGGYFEFRVPNAAFAYNQYVWAWVNVTDTQYNGKNTWEDGSPPWVRINDTIVPYINWGVGHNDNPNSYHLAKPTQIIPAEPADASGLTTIRVYWRQTLAVTFPGGYDGFADVTGFTSTGGVQLNVDIPTDDFYYGMTIHYRFEIIDTVGNVNYTSDRSFLVIDTKAPEYILYSLNAEFLWLMPSKAKNFTFTLSDPDYGGSAPHRSSGTQRIEFYYKLRDIDQAYLLNGTVILPLDGDTVTFQLPYNASFAGSTDLDYMIKVYDIYGTINTTTGSIKIATSLTVTVTSPHKVGGSVTLPPGTTLPWAGKYYHNSLAITFRFVFTGKLGFSEFALSSAVWFKFDEGAVEGPALPGGDMSISISRSFSEGTHNITIWMYNATDAQFGFLEFKIDVTPPAQPTNLKAVLTDDGVQLTWNTITDEDAVTYIIYRGLFPDFDPLNGEGIIVRSDLVTNSVTDDDVLLDMITYYYKVYAVDAAGNPSALTGETSFSKPMPPWMWIVVAGIAAGVVVGLVVAVRARGERKLLMAAMEKSEKAAPVSKEEDWTKVAEAARKRQESAPAASKESATKAAATEGKKWATIQTTPVSKPAVSQPAPAARGAYWKGELQELLAKVVQAEEAGNYAEELRVLEIVQRVAQQMQDHEALTMAQQKIKDVWAKLNA